jgi:hypothetical protein
MAESKVDLPKDLQDVIGGFLKLTVADIKEHTKYFFRGQNYLSCDFDRNKEIYRSLLYDAERPHTEHYNPHKSKTDEMNVLFNKVRCEIHKCIDWYTKVIPRGNPDFEYNINMITAEIADEYSLYCYAVRFMKLSEFVYKRINYNARYGNIKYTVPCWGA